MLRNSKESLIKCESVSSSQSEKKTLRAIVAIKAAAAVLPPLLWSGQKSQSDSCQEGFLREETRMTFAIFCYRHPSFMMHQDASMGRFDAISRFPGPSVMWAWTGSLASVPAKAAEALLAEHRHYHHCSRVRFKVCFSQTIQFVLWREHLCIMISAQKKKYWPIS